MEHSKTLITYLLQSKSIIIDPANPFHWSSGWKSPIYCDNRRTLSYPEIRNFIRDSFIETMKQEFQVPDIIAGVATGAIAHAALVADASGLPLVYVRPAHKSHGMKNLIEGDISVGKSVLIIEDLVSTGSSSLIAAEALREAGCRVIGMLAIFSYGFSIAEEKFRKAGIEMVSLATYHDLVKQGITSGYIDSAHAETLNEWREHPETWGS
jgi:orotate phosphoribosyltransferase